MGLSLLGDLGDPQDGFPLVPFKATRTGAGGALQKKTGPYTVFVAPLRTRCHLLFPRRWARLCTAGEEALESGAAGGLERPKPIPIGTILVGDGLLKRWAVPFWTVLGYHRPQSCEPAGASTS